jgi:hypothetical protein
MGISKPLSALTRLHFVLPNTFSIKGQTHTAIVASGF